MYKAEASFLTAEEGTRHRTLGLGRSEDERFFIKHVLSVFRWCTRYRQR
jgi:hypothetical protein